MEQPYPKVGQVWKIKDNLNMSAYWKGSYIFIVRVSKHSSLGDTVSYERIGDNKNKSSFVTWLMLNAELVSG
jgi:apolipoprotein N-acyltransferase